LILLNFLNYVDRHLLPGALPIMHETMQISDVQIGSMISWFFFAYMWGAPLLGWLGDWCPRPLLVLLSCGAWSLMLGLATFTEELGSFRWAYALTGIAMSGFGVFGVAMLSDFAHREMRSRSFSLFLLAMTAGRALGFPLGGWLAQLFGWKAPFRICATTGLLLTFLLAFVFPSFKRTDMVLEERTGGAREPYFRPDIARKLFTPRYLIPVFGLAMHTFTFSGLNAWLPMFLYREANYTPASASTLFGAAAFSCGLSGTWVGGALGDRLSRYTTKALHWISAASFVLAAPCVAVILLHSPVGVVCGVFGLQFFLACALAPLNTALIHSIPVTIRATGIGAGLLIVHAFGDVPSPHLIGAISEHHGLPLGISTTLIGLILGAAVLLFGMKLPSAIA
jgi:MFS family permease